MNNTIIRQPRIDHINRTITVTKTFMDAAADYGTEEFDLIGKIQASCPGYNVVIAKHRKPRNKVKRPTFAMMRNYIGCLRDSEANLAIFEKVVEYGKAQQRTYATVSSWFCESFPDYGCIPSFDKAGNPIIEMNIVPYDRFVEGHAAKAQDNRNEQLSTAAEQEHSKNEQLRAS